MERAAPTLFSAKSRAGCGLLLGILLEVLHVLSDDDLCTNGRTEQMGMLSAGVGSAHGWIGVELWSCASPANCEDQATWLEAIGR